MENTETRRYFELSSMSCLRILMYRGDLVPQPSSKDVKLRVHRWEGDFILRYQKGEYALTIEEEGRNGWKVYTNDIQKVYRAIKEAEKSATAKYQAKEIIRPVLPSRIYKTIQSNIFDFFKSIDAFGSTRGFGNTGVLLYGPPGTGKSETMRWISEEARENFSRGSFKISYSALQKLLADGHDINPCESLVFIDDIDMNILRDRRKGNDHPLTPKFMSCLDGLDKREGRVVVISTNEAIDNIDPAFKRPGRFEESISFEYPSNDLIDIFCKQRGLELSSDRFIGWSFPKIDMFIAKYKVANFLHGTSINVFYEEFIHKYGATDKTIEECESYYAV